MLPAYSIRGCSYASPQWYLRAEAWAAIDENMALATHVIVADSGSARLMRLVGPRTRRSIEQVELFERPSNPHTVEIERFVDRIARQLVARHAAGELSALVLIAEPRLPGVMRARLPKALQGLITHEICGDYIHAKDAQLLGPIEAKEQPQG
jgi:hypothetical protein